ncbi:TPA: hypothetical protein QD007_004174, partial [Shewanella algae]|nr:hypothetical protein [Shewanella algae]
MTLTINELSKLLDDVKCQADIDNAEGWYFSNEKNKTYVPARLTKNEQFNGDINAAKIILVSAPGAVGKSVMARELSNITGCIYLDLSKASTIAGNYIIGGLAHNNALNSWINNEAGLVIDSLDEARLRVTQSSFEDFLCDVYKVSMMNKNPIIIFGRVGIIEETWLILNESHGVDCPVLDIEFFNSDEAENFIYQSLVSLSSDEKCNSDYKHLHTSLNEHSTVYKSAIKEIISSLGKISGDESTRFVGYAPVLDAVSKFVGTISNPSKIDEEMANVLNGKFLLNICDAILHREQGKLTSQLNDKFESFSDNLYTSNEQISRLASRILKTGEIPVPKEISPDLVAAYQSAVDSMLPQHPFLDGTGRKFASSVFEAYILCRSLLSDDVKTSDEALHYFLNGRNSPNPFLFEFFNELNVESIKCSHVGVLFDSVLSRLTNSESASLTISDDEELTFVTFGVNDLEYDFSATGDVVKLGNKVSNVFINSDALDVYFASSEQLEIVSPVSILCDTLYIDSDKVIVKSASANPLSSSVIIEANELSCNKAVNVPVVRPNAELHVNWPGSESFPWSSFSNKLSSETSDERVAGALRVFRRIIMAFRSHSKGRLARLKDKVNHN